MTTNKFILEWENVGKLQLTVAEITRPIPSLSINYLRKIQHYIALKTRFQVKMFSVSKCIISIPWFFNYGIIQSKYNSINNYNNHIFVSNYISDIYYNNFKVIKSWHFGHEINLMKNENPRIMISCPKFQYCITLKLL